MDRSAAVRQPAGLLAEEQNHRQNLQREVVRRGEVDGPTGRLESPVEGARPRVEIVREFGQ